MQGTIQIATVQGEQKAAKTRSDARAVQGFPVTENQTRNDTRVVGQGSDDKKVEFSAESIKIIHGQKVRRTRTNKSCEMCTRCTAHTR